MKTEGGFRMTKETKFIIAGAIFAVAVIAALIYSTISSSKKEMMCCNYCGELEPCSMYVAYELTSNSDGSLGYPERNVFLSTKCYEECQNDYNALEKMGWLKVEPY